MADKKTALVISAHAADFVWRCGGAIALHQDLGYEVTVACLSFGERGESAKLWKEDGMTLETVKEVRKAEAQAALAGEFGLPPGDGPLCVVVSRLSWQKGLDLLLEALPGLLRRGGRLALLGSGDPGLENAWRETAAREPSVSVRIGYDEALSHRLIAGGGDDRLTGGAGADRFVFTPKDGFNFVTDFRNGIDKIGIKGVGGFGALNITEVAGDTVIKFLGTTIRLDGVDSDLIDQRDFVFGRLAAEKPAAAAATPEPEDDAFAFLNWGADVLL